MSSLPGGDLPTGSDGWFRPIADCHELSTKTYSTLARSDENYFRDVEPLL